MSERKRIGRWNDIATRQVVYESDLGIEVDELDHFEIVRRRVFWDDVLLVTMHKERGLGFIATMAFFCIGFIALAFVASSTTPFVVTFGIFAAIAFLFGFARLVLQLDVITVFGRRSRAAVRFGFRKARAREVFDSLCARVAGAQQHRAEEIAASEPPPPPPPAEELVTDAFPPLEQ